MKKVCLAPLAGVRIHLPLKAQAKSLSWGVKAGEKGALCRWSGREFQKRKSLKRTGDLWGPGGAKVVGGGERERPWRRLPCGCGRGSFAASSVLTPGKMWNPSWLLGEDERGSCNEADSWRVPSPRTGGDIPVLTKYLDVPGMWMSKGLPSRPVSGFCRVWDFVVWDFAPLPADQNPLLNELS